MPPANQSEPLPERRRSARVDLLANLQGHLVTLDERIQVRQVSLGGMTVETTAPLSPRLEHEFRLAVGDRSVTVRARVVHGRVSVHDDVVSFLAGVEFVEPTTDALTVLRELMESARTGGRE